MKDRIAYKLINAEDNAVLLSGVPHFRYLDLAVVFYIIVAESEEGQMTALIHDEHLNLWNITADDLSLLSEQNTGTLLPWEREMKVRSRTPPSFLSISMS